HELDTAPLVFAVELGVAVVVADQCAALNICYREHAEVVPWAVVGEIQILSGAVAGAEHLVVTVEEFASVGNNVEAVVRFVPARESMRRPKDDPEPQLTRQGKSLESALPEQTPIKLLIRGEVRPRVAREGTLGKVCHVCASALRDPHLVQYVPLVSPNVRVHRKLAGRNRDPHEAISSSVGVRAR